MQRGIAAPRIAVNVSAVQLRKRDFVGVNRRRDGTIFWARERSSVRRDANGKPRYVVTHVDKLSGFGGDPLARLSRRERQVLELVVAGRTSKDIAAQLGVSPATVDTYRRRIMLKLGIQDLPGLVRFAIRHGIASV